MAREGHGPVAAVLGAAAGVAGSVFVLALVRKAFTQEYGSRMLPGQKFSPSPIPRFIHLLAPIATGYYVGSRLSPNHKIAAGVGAVVAPLGLMSLQR